MKIIVKSLFLAAIPFFTTTVSGAAKDCNAQLHGGVIVIVSDDTLVATIGPKAIGEFALPVVGSFWRCIQMVAFPDQKLVIVEWHEGSAGTSKIFSRASLLAFSVDASGVVPKGGWVLTEALQGASEPEFLVRRTYEIEENDGRVDIVFTGIHRVSVSPD
jgi:hypothetical protein